MTGSTISSERPYPAIDIIEFFKTRSVLVVAAVAALDAMPAALETMVSLLAAPDGARWEGQLRTLQGIVDGAAIGADNLLVADPASVHEPFVMCAVSRQPSGAVDIRTIELDRDMLALAGASRGIAGRPLDRLAAAIHAFGLDGSSGARAGVTAAIDAMAAQVRASVSRLSIVKARLDLQQSFLSSVMDADVGSPPVRLDSHLNQAGARDMALEARRLLSGRSLTVASGNRKTLASLFETHAAKEA